MFIAPNQIAKVSRDRRVVALGDALKRVQVERSRNAYAEHDGFVRRAMLRVRDFLLDGASVTLNFIFHAVSYPTRQVGINTTRNYLNFIKIS